MKSAYKPQDIENARQNLSRYSWAQEIVNGWAQSVAFAMQQDRAFFDTTIPELTPGTHYGQNCPNCVGKQSLMGGGLFDWHIDSPDEITCRACGAVYPTRSTRRPASWYARRWGSNSPIMKRPKKWLTPKIAQSTRSNGLGTALQ